MVRETSSCRSNALSPNFIPTMVEPLSEFYPNKNIPSTSLTSTPTPSTSNPFISTPSTYIPHGTSTLKSSQFSALERQSSHQSSPSYSHSVSTETTASVAPVLSCNKRTARPLCRLLEEMYACRIVYDFVYYYLDNQKNKLITEIWNVILFNINVFV